MNFKSLLLIASFVLLTSCALKPIPSQMEYQKIENVELDQLGNGKVMIYNGSNVFHKADNTERLNIHINDKALGQLRGSEYVIINLADGDYKFDVLHLDMVNMRSSHQVTVDSQTKVIMIKPNITSNKLEVTNELPEKWEKFKYVEER
ncbi:hypothetical protein [Nonlabens agnitus]|uniref:DUF2846 domain-containing protein n=1 Tax=Nonlabens agnitus TaxID=870484 RepID=A0A2S9WWL1_9FLAO|nr:hypothetical protein [Nonlabens agnitus]PRP67869.1 hypothetical protein BST86_12555 [Nonlabens agnitus]